MICCVCNREINKSLAASGFIGNYCQRCAIEKGLTTQQIFAPCNNSNKPLPEENINEKTCFLYKKLNTINNEADLNELYFLSEQRFCAQCNNRSLVYIKRLNEIRQGKYGLEVR